MEREFTNQKNATRLKYYSNNSFGLLKRASQETCSLPELAPKIKKVTFSHTGYYLYKKGLWANGI